VKISFTIHDPTIIIDTREQCPLEFLDLPAERGTLDVGDYSIKGLMHLIAIERKSLADLVGCFGNERERFEREMVRIQARRFRAVVVEATYADIEAGEWRSKILPQVVTGSVASWSMRYGVPFFWCGDALATARWTEKLLYQAARHIAWEYAHAARLCEAGKGSQLEAVA